MRPRSLSITTSCDSPNKPSQSQSNGNSPAIRGGTGNEFFGTEFYIDESLPSSLSEPQEEAFVSLLQVLMPRKSQVKCFKNLGHFQFRCAYFKDQLIRQLKFCLKNISIKVFYYSFGETIPND